jgi:DNA repair photolyase
VLAETWTPFSIITRGPLVVRDIDVLQQASSRAAVGVYFSIPTLDEHVWRTTEPGTAPPRSRLEAIRRLTAAGIEVGVGVAPILPGLSDRPEQLEDVVREARAAGARGVWANVVYLRPGTREHFLEALAADFPEQVDRYEQLFAGRAYLPEAVAAPIKKLVQDAADSAPIKRRPRLVRQPAPPRGEEQLALAV